eukprot:TRINITY_DN17805_c0_g1_i1.p1 TRINITY_DN17805_c0_g1~~TRINITY_DN17805_c0_g1_i1.p1  ORF type:complete len:435 (+),score=117.88 TRINITY_DN17805_c0_g1_i1:83-1306(+)
MAEHLQIGLGHHLAEQEQLQHHHAQHHGQTLTSLLQTPDDDKLPTLPNPLQSALRSARIRFANIFVRLYVKGTAIPVEHAAAIPTDEPLRKRQKTDGAFSAEIKYVGHPGIKIPKVFIGNLYYKKVAEADARLGQTMGPQLEGRTLALDNTSATGLFVALRKVFPEKGEVSYPQKEIHSSARVAKLYPELGVEEDDFTRLRLIHGLEIQHHPDLNNVDLTQDDIDWFRQMVGRASLDISEAEYKHPVTYKKGVTHMTMKERQEHGITGVSRSSKSSKANSKKSGPPLGAFAIQILPDGGSRPVTDCQILGQASKRPFFQVKLGLPWHANSPDLVTVELTDCGRLTVIVKGTETFPEETRYEIGLQSSIDVQKSKSRLQGTHLLVMAYPRPQQTRTLEVALADVKGHA